MNRPGDFTVMVGDLVRSRDIPDRQQVSQKVRTGINRISKIFHREFYAPLVLTRGIDELSAVLNRPHRAYAICKDLNEEVYPYAFRFVVVRGPLDIAISSKNAAKMDGPAFHQASDLIHLAKKENRSYCFRIGFQVKEIEPWVNEVLNLLQIVRSGWSDHQRQVVRLYDKLGKQEAVAERLNITQQAISDALRQARWKDLKRAEEMIEQLLEKAGEAWKQA